MQLNSTSFADGQRIPGDHAFCLPDPAHHVCLGRNRNPQLTWSPPPSGTRSIAIICHDPDVPSRGDDVNQEGRSVPASLPRVDFFHWILIDLPPEITSIAAGEYSKEVTPRGKAGPAAAHGARQGINDYTGWFASDRDMRGDYYGYDGPYPPFNDLRMHRYFFRLFALDVPTLALPADFTAGDAFHAMHGHVLAEAATHGTYRLATENH